MRLRELRERVLEANLTLPRERLVVMTSGNASARDPESGLVVIKPSGVSYHDLTAADLPIVDLEGRTVDGRLRPSIDTSAHLEVYRQRPEVGGVIHTHSPYATSFAAREEGVPAAVTAIADEFGGPVPVTATVEVGGPPMGAAAVAASPEGRAVILRRHGVLTFDGSVEDAVRAAVMLEECAHSIAIARACGPLEPIDDATIEDAHRFHTDNYGQSREE